MENKINKLDEKVKRSLRNYKASNQSADWSRMEMMLDATANPISSKRSYALLSLIALVILSGAYFIYNNTNDSKVSSLPKIETNTTSVVAKPSVEIKKENNVAPIETPVVATKPTMKKKVAEIQTATDNTPKNPQQIMVMGNKAVFPDMLDTTLGILGETAENERTQKAAVLLSEHPIIWNKFIIPDSLMRYTVEHIVDSLKGMPKGVLKK